MQRWKAKCYVAELVVEDTFTFVKSRGGGGDVYERLYLKTSLPGSLLLNEPLEELFGKIQPGCVIKAAIIETKTIKDIVDLEILQEVAPPEPLPADMVSHKYMSEVNICGFEDGTYVYNKLFLVTPLNFYLIVNKAPVKVNWQQFREAKLHSQYGSAAPISLQQQAVAQ